MEQRFPAARAGDPEAAVMLRHKEEWARHQALMDEALACGDADKAKLAKLAAETLKIRQEGERKAWGIADKTGAEPAASGVERIEVIFVDAKQDGRPA